MKDKGFSIFLSKKVPAFQLFELHKASILGRLWQKNHSYNSYRRINN
ncbi:MAG: hypothetical protein F6K17_41625 [Okeania sp. SIO3C4]|nr:hypothetical protein [Okeania sp. SIO3C4]